MITGLLLQFGPRPCLLIALKRAPTAGPVAPSSHSTLTMSGVSSGVRVTSATRAYSASGDASM